MQYFPERPLGPPGPPAPNAPQDFEVHTRGTVKALEERIRALEQRVKALAYQLEMAEVSRRGWRS